MFNFIKKSTTTDEKSGRKKDKKDRKDKKRDRPLPDEILGLDEVRRSMKIRGRRKEKEKLPSGITADYTASFLASLNRSESPTPSSSLWTREGLTQSDSSEASLTSAKNLPAVPPRPPKRGILKGPRSSLTKNGTAGMDLAQNTLQNELITYQNVPVNGSGNTVADTLILVTDEKASLTIITSTSPSADSLTDTTTNSSFATPPFSLSPVGESQGCHRWSKTSNFDDLTLPLPPIINLILPKPRTLTIQRQPSPRNDFGFSLRRAMIVERNTDNSNGPNLQMKAVIFAEPGNMVQHHNETGLLPGDRLLEVNGVCVDSKTREEIIDLIKGSKESVTVKVQPVAELSELSRRSTQDGREIDLDDSNIRGGTLRRSGSRRFNRIGAKSEAELLSDSSFLTNDLFWLVHRQGFTSCTLLSSSQGPLSPSQIEKSPSGTSSSSENALNSGKLQVRLLDTGDVLMVDEDDIERANPKQFDRVEDISQLRYLNEASVLNTIRQRYATNLIHTYAGTNMIIVNPMAPLAIYSDKVVSMFKGCKSEDLPPHIFSMAQSCYHTMLSTRKDQSLVFLGRSGSGKTINFRHSIQYLIQVSGCVNKFLTLEKLNAVWRVQENFGNCRSTVNSNATRFTQIFSLDFDQSGVIASASIQILLLERSRIGRRLDNESTFHIMYRLLAGVEGPLRKELFLDNLTQSQESNPFIIPLHKHEDKQRAQEDFQKVCSALHVLNVSEVDQKVIWSVLAAIYHLGCAGAVRASMPSSSSPKYQFSHPQYAQRAAHLLGTTVEELSRVIFSLGSQGSAATPTGSRGAFRTPSPTEKANGVAAENGPIELLEAMIVGLYAEVFNCVAALVNRSISQSTHTVSSILLVDTPGFQNPASCGRQTGAGFEDLCHNYLQERLQMLFHQTQLVAPRDKYLQENVELGWETDVDGVANPGAMVNLLDKPSQSSVLRTSQSNLSSLDRRGLLWLLDDDTLYHSPSSSTSSEESTWLDRALSASGGIDSGLARRAPGHALLALQHLQGTAPVLYGVSGWRRKSREQEGTRLAVGLLQESANLDRALSASGGVDSGLARRAPGHALLALQHLQGTAPVLYGVGGWRRKSREQEGTRLAVGLLQESANLDRALSASGGVDSGLARRAPGHALLALQHLQGTAPVLYGVGGWRRKSREQEGTRLAVGLLQESANLDRALSASGGVDSGLARRAPGHALLALQHLQGTAPVLYGVGGWRRKSKEQEGTRLAVGLLQESAKEDISRLFVSVRGLGPSSMGGSVVGIEGSQSLRRASSIRRTFTSGTAGIKRKSLCLQVKFTVDGLIETLRRTRLRFVHCLLPQHNAGLCESNTALLAVKSASGQSEDNVINVPLIRSQIRGGQVLDATRFYKQGFPTSLPLSEFQRRFRLLAGETRPPSPIGDERRAAEELLMNVDVDSAGYRVGMSLIFFRSGLLTQLESRRDERLQGRVTSLQAHCRGFLARRRLQHRRLQDLAVRCLQRNVRRFMAVRDWPWWRLLVRVTPLLNVCRTEEQLKIKTEELETLRSKVEKLEQERSGLKHDNDKLEAKLSEMTADLAEEHSTATLATERLDAENQERVRLERELEEIQNKNRQLQQSSERLEMELLYARSDMNGLNSEEDEDGEIDGGVYKQRYERVSRELEFTRRRLQQQHEDDLEQLVGLKKQLEKKLADAYEEVEEQRQVVGQWKRKVQKLNAETNDLRLLLEEQNARNNLLEKKQRKFDSETQLLHDELRQEKQTKERIAREKEVVLAEKYTLENNLADTRLELELQTEKLHSLQREVDEITFGGKTEEEVALLRKQKMELERKNHEQEEELDELAGQTQILEQAKLRLEMALEQSRKESKREAQQRDEELEEVRCNAQKKLKALEAQLENEHEERTLLLRDKHQLERQLSSLTSQANNSRAGDEALLQRLKRDLRRTKALLRDAQTLLERQRADSPGKGVVRQLRNQLEDAECARQNAVKAKQVLEAELSESVALCEEAQRQRSEAEDRFTSAHRERTELRTQLEENEEELAEVLKKYKAAVQQMSVDQLALQEQVSLVSELEGERNSLKEQLAELTVKLESIESGGDPTSNLMAKRMELRSKELESKLELEQTTRSRLEVQIARLKETVDKLQTEIATSRTKETQAQDSIRRLQRSLRELRDEHTATSSREAECLQKRKELEKKFEAAEAETSVAKADLRLAMKRIEDLQSAIQGELEDTISDNSDSEQDSYSSDESIETFLANHKLTSSKSTDRSLKLDSPH